MTANEFAHDEQQIWPKGWFPVLFGLSRIIPRGKLDVRTRALTVMFDILKSYGEKFQAAWWKDLFQVIFRVFDDKKLQSMSSEQEKSDWMDTTCSMTLQCVIDVLTQYFPLLQDVVLEDVFAIIKWTMQTDNEQLVLAGE